MAGTSRQASDVFKDLLKAVFVFVWFCMISLHRFSKGGHQIFKTFLVTQMQSSDVGDNSLLIATCARSK